MSTVLKRDKWIPWYFVLFFVVVAAVNAVMVTLALRSYSGTVTDHPYEKGLAYNKVVAAANEQDALGWKAGILYKQGKLHYVLQDKNGIVLKPDMVEASISRPTQRGLDFALPLAGEATQVDFPEKGVWEVRVDALYQGKHHQHMQRIVVP